MIFITYPRSGVNFLVNSIEKNTGTKVHYSHEMVAIRYNKPPILNIVRNPKDAMASWLAMQDHLAESIVKMQGYKSTIEIFQIPKYVQLYNFLLKQDTIFIKYEDINNPNLIKILANRLYLDYVEDTNKDISYEGLDGYLPTSKDTQNYQEILETLDKIDLSQCYELYSMALERCIDVPKL